jgi:hypothetical protein
MVTENWHGAVVLMRPIDRDPWTLRRCRLVGATGSVALAIGACAVGALPARDPFAAMPGIRDLRAAPVLAMACAYLGLGMLLVAWWRIGRLVRRPGRVDPRDLVTTLIWWAAPLAVAAPMFSRDVYSYLAQGAMVAAGIDPYTFGPSTLGGPLAANVPEIWQHTPAPYGPLFLNLASAVTGITGGHTVLGALGMRAVALAGVAVMAWGVPELARRCGVDPAAALWLGVLNPLVLDHLVAGAHNDAVMLGLLVAGLVAVTRRHPVIGVALVTTAAMVKAPAALALAFIVPVWAGQLAGPYRMTKTAAGTGAVALVSTALVTAASDTGYGWTQALGTPAVVRNWMSVTTDLGHLTGAVPTFRALGIIIAGTIVAGLALRAWRRPAENPAGPFAAFGLALLAIVLLGPVVHPWYLLWGLVPLAAAARPASHPRGRRALAGMSVIVAVLLLPTGLGPTAGQVVSGAVGLAVGVLLGGLVDGAAWRASATSHHGLGQRHYPTMGMEVTRRTLRTEN